MSSSEVGRKFTFWVVYDTTGDRQFVKMDSDTNCLAMFDNEKSAAAFASGLVGVGYKEVVLYSCPQPLPLDVAELVDALEEIAQWVDRWASADHPVATVVRKAPAAYYKKGGEA